MPIYEYRCSTCKTRIETLQKVNDPPKKKCPHCGGSLKKMISSPAIQFKGTGFYITDYAKKTNPGKDDKPKEKEKPKTEKTEGVKPGSKPSADSSGG
jgi:putative FmdB family regulatory protein